MANLLLNFVAVILPSLLFQVLWLDKRSVNTPTKHRLLIFISSLVSQITCLAFSLHLIHGFPIGLEDIPIILGALYGGYVVGSGLVATALIYRLTLDTQVIPVLVVFHLLMVSTTFLFVPLFHRLRKQHKVLAALSLALLSSITVSASVLYITHSLKTALFFFFVYGILNTSTITITTLLIEMIQDQQLLMENAFKTKQYQVIGELAASIAHEIRNPLTTIRGFAQLMLEQDVPFDERKQYLELVLSEVDRTLIVAGEYMGIAKPEVGHVEIIDARAIVQATATVLTPYANLHGVELHIGKLKSGFVRADKVKLEQVLINLVKNAIEATFERGVVTLSSIVMTHEQAVYITIDDHGIGMDPEELSKIGNPFYSTKTGGTGLGLTTSYRLIQAMNGAMNIQSIKGRGTSVSVRLPLEDQARDVP